MKILLPQTGKVYGEGREVGVPVGGETMIWKEIVTVRETGAEMNLEGGVGIVTMATVVMTAGEMGRGIVIGRREVGNLIATETGGTMIIEIVTTEIIEIVTREIIEIEMTEITQIETTEITGIVTTEITEIVMRETGEETDMMTEMTTEGVIIETDPNMM